ncbi:hypothetical protein ACRPOS_005655 [Bartonella heixiaziensis]
MARVFSYPQVSDIAPLNFMNLGVRTGSSFGLGGLAKDYKL